VQETFSSWTETWLNAYRDLRDQTLEAAFDAMYGSPLLQALVGLGASDESPRRQPGREIAHIALVAQRIQELKDAIPQGGPREAAIRALLYVRMPDGVVDERGFNFLRRMREEAGQGMSLAEFKRVVREQFFMLLVDGRRAVEAVPGMLAKDPALAARVRAMLRRHIETLGLRSDEAKARLAELQNLLAEGVESPTAHVPGLEGQHFVKVRPLPVHTEKRPKHGGTAR
jgi:hypothetical protein